MKGNLRMISHMDLVKFNTRMEVITLAIGQMIRKREKGSMFGLKVASIKVSTSRIRGMDKGNILGLMEVYMTANGSQICKTATASSLIKMDATKAVGKTASNTAKAFTLNLMALFLKAHLLTISVMAQAK